MAPHFTLERHLSPIPSPNGTAPHARGTFLPHSVAQRCISARSGNTSVPFRRLTAPRRTPGRHFNPVPSPNSTKTHTWATLTPIPSPDGTATHARGTLQPRSVASEGGERGTDGRRGGKTGPGAEPGTGTKKRSPGHHETSGAPRGTAATYSPNWCVSTIGARGLNCSVRYGKRWDPAAKATANIT